MGESTTNTRVVVVSNPEGLHARPAHALATAASRFRSNIEIIRNGEAADGKSILAILTLAATQGVQLTLRATGQDAVAALDALEELFVAGFGERGDQPESQTPGQA